MSLMIEKKTIHLLILEDYPNDAELAVKELGREGFTVEWSRVETEEAFRKALEKKPDLILADYVVPSFGGIDALKVQQELAPEVPLIIISGRIGEDTAVECVKSGAIDYILKDNLSRLGPIVKRALKEAQEHRELKQAEDALRESEDRFRTLVEFSPFGISIMKPDKSFEYFNPKFTKLFGYTKDDIPDKQAWFEKAYPDEKYRKKAVSIWKEDLVEDVKIGEIKPRIFTVRCENGQDKIIQIRSVVLKNGDHFLTYEDISARVKAEEERKELENQLQVAKKMESIATLAGGVAHEFNNALIGITGNIEFLNMDLPNDENVTKYTESMKSSAHRMAHLTNQLLAYARGGKYHDKIVSLNDFVEDALPLIKHNIKPDIRIETNLPKDILNVKADLTQMQMVLSTILTNSDEALEGPGRIRIITTNEDIDGEFARTHAGLKAGCYVCLTIEDDGKGMDEDTKSKIFEPFFTTRFQGRGLGMAAVYGIVKNHGGWISVESEPNKGTTIRIYLPAIWTKATLYQQDPQSS